MKWKAHAKLNLALDITGRRPDGYHLLDTVIQEITLCDDLDIIPADTIEIDCPGIPDDQNILRPAAEAFFRAAGIRAGAVIRIQKRIPAGAGMGGGSSDAAAVLLALNEMHGHPLRRTQLLEAAVHLGADVPAFINGSTPQRARGIGEILTPIGNRSSFLYLLVQPAQSISTLDAYRLYDELPHQPHVNIDNVTRALQSGDLAAFCSAAGNALLPAALQLVPEIAQIGEDCMGNGAAFWMLTGSGSCVFSIFRDERTRAAAKDKLSRMYPFVETAEDFIEAEPTENLRKA